MSKVSLKKILPPHLGGLDDHTYRALLGDKLLAVEVVRALPLILDDGAYKDMVQVTQILQVAISNSFLATNIPKILPNASAHLKQLQGEHALGTVVEAAVASVSDENPDAVKDLAFWLTEEAIKQGHQNFKGQLLQLGGKIETTKVGGPAHHPVFRSRAHYKTYQTKATGSSKKETEQLAAQKVILECFGTASESNVDENFKGRLLELGGYIETEKIGGPDHDPIFRAVSHYSNQLSEATATTKKQAEQLAAKKLLHTCFGCFDSLNTLKGRLPVEKITLRHGAVNKRRPKKSRRIRQRRFRGRK